MKELLRRPLFQTVILTGLTACLPQLPPQSPTLEVSFRVSATVSYVEDVANPQGRSGDFSFPNIPDFRIKESQKHIVVPKSGFFKIGCRGEIVFKKDGEEVNTQGFAGSVSDDGKVMYFFPPDEDHPTRFTLDYNQAWRVDNGQYKSNLLRKGAITVDEEVVKQQTFTEIDTTGVGLGKMTEALKFPLGKHQVSCIFETQGGKVYQDTATVETIDARI